MAQYVQGKNMFKDLDCGLGTSGGVTGGSGSGSGGSGSGGGGGGSATTTTIAPIVCNWPTSISLSSTSCSYDSAAGIATISFFFKRWFTMFCWILRLILRVYL